MCCLLRGVEMEIKVNRVAFTAKSTIGDMLIDDQWECFTLEDVVRGPGIKIPGQTAIPEGKYEVIIDRSMRFKRMMPHILNVPMFEGIRIHSGNTDRNTEGCLLLGRTKDTDFIGQSVAAFNAFFPKLQEGLQGGKVFITIS